MMRHAWSLLGIPLLATLSGGGCTGSYSASTANEPPMPVAQQIRLQSTGEHRKKIIEEHKKLPLRRRQQVYVPPRK